MDTVIQFIGLFVFTTLTTGGNATGRTALQASNPNISQTVVVAIAPSVIGDPLLQRSTTTAAPRKNAIAQETKATTAQTGSHGDFVEAHKTMIVYRPQDLVPSSPVTGWTTTKLKQNDPEDWHYVVLSGEQITFVADMANVDIDANSLKFLPLRHLGPTQLLSAYTPSGQYSRAAAVFTIPKGILSVCSHGASPEGLQSRVDTRLTLQVSSTLTIQGPGNKSITLWAGAPVFIGNVPLAFATSGTVSANAHEHYKVYCEMVAAPTCTWPPDPLKPEQLASSIHDCGLGVVYRKSAGHQRGPTLPSFVEPNQMNDFACSNTQWP
jgi:hypothetical protein